MRAHPAGPRHADIATEHGVLAPPADLGHLVPHVWPSGLVRGDDGGLSLHGHSVDALVAAFGTPVMILDEADFRVRAQGFADAFSDADVYYAAKAFLCTSVARWVAEEGLGLDVATGGELAVAVRAGFPAERLLMHGNNKSVEELHDAVAAGVARIVVDSLAEIDRLAEVARQADTAQAVLVRVTVGVEAHTHEFIATAHEDQKFGFSLASGDADRAVAEVLRHDALKLVGLHSHIGSQIFDTSGFEIAAHRAVEMMARIRDVHGIELPELDLGGGLGIAYVAADDPAELVDVAASLRRIVERECAGYDLPVPRLSVEPGRALVGPSTITVYQVGTVKPVELDGGLVRTYVSVDGGMSDNIRTALYDCDYTVTLANRQSEAPPALCRVVGKHCETGDVVVRDAWLPSDVTPGDLLAVAATGAYCRAMASTYNFVGRAPVVAVPAAADHEPYAVVRRETLADLLTLDPFA